MGKGDIEEHVPGLLGVRHSTGGLEQGTGEPQQEVKWQRWGAVPKDSIFLPETETFVLRAMGSHQKVLNRRTT